MMLVSLGTSRVKVAEARASGLVNLVLCRQTGFLSATIRLLIN